MEDSNLDRPRSKKIFRIVKIVTESASFALILSIIFFGIEMFNNMKESKDVTQNLLNIQNALSTKYLGEFPNFVPDIYRLYTDAKAGDSIVIIEDVLFYGITSVPEKFYESHVKLLELAGGGPGAASCPVLVAYYKPNGMAYNFTIQEWLLSQENYKNYRDTMRLFYLRNMMFRTQRKVLIDSCFANNVPKEETDQRICHLMDRCFNDIIGAEFLTLQKEYVLAQTIMQDVAVERNFKQNMDDNEVVRNILLERYFDKTREIDKKKFKMMVEKYRQPTVNENLSTTSSRTRIEALEMCRKMDAIRTKYLGNEGDPVDNIKFADFMNMFTEMTVVMEETYSHYPSITKIPIDDFLSVRCWLVCGENNESQAIMAFPSRYSSSEIGFYTTDESTRDYIKTMERGILINYIPAK